MTLISQDLPSEQTHLPLTKSSSSVLSQECIDLTVEAVRQFILLRKAWSQL